MVNKVILVGFVGRDPEAKTTRNGRNWTSFRLATSERWRDPRTGERKEKTEWHNIVSFDDNKCEFIEEYVKKGMRLYIEGKQRTRSWDDASGQKHYATDTVLEAFHGVIILLDRKGGGRGNIDDDAYGETPGDSYGQHKDQSPSDQQRAEYDEQAAAQDGSRSFGDDDIPF